MKNLKTKPESSMTVWYLRRGADHRFRLGHPWVYANELTESPKGLLAGDPVELRDHAGKFLSRGYGNPHSLISFRSLSRDPLELLPHTATSLFSKLTQAIQLRVIYLGLKELSYRMCFGEADGLPGLIIDRYRSHESQVFVIQAHTAGADRWISFLPELLENCQLFLKDSTVCSAACSIAWSNTAIILRNNISTRRLEGLSETKEVQILKNSAFINFYNVKILVPSATLSINEKPIEFSVNLLEGQKTGFFLDQSTNIQMAAFYLIRFFKQFKLKKLRILDLFCYVGQWSAQLAQVLGKAGYDVEVTAIDSSAQALQFAEQNIQAQGAQCEILKLDIIQDLRKKIEIEKAAFNIVICDPPALIKSRKNLAVGAHAYLQLNTQALQLVKKGGALITCSCSSLLEEEHFLQILAKAAHRNPIKVQWLWRGVQAPDHPILAEFPEGRYLKCWMGAVT